MVNGNGCGEPVDVREVYRKNLMLVTNGALSSRQLDLVTGMLVEVETAGRNAAYAERDRQVADLQRVVADLTALADQKSRTIGDLHDKLDEASKWAHQQEQDATAFRVENELLTLEVTKLRDTINTKNETIEKMHRAAAADVEIAQKETEQADAEIRRLRQTVNRLTFAIENVATIRMPTEQRLVHYLDRAQDDFVKGTDGAESWVTKYSYAVAVVTRVHNEINEHLNGALNGAHG